MVIFKGIFHVHSNYSNDAKFSIDDIREKYKDYNFIIITDHLEHLSKEKYKKFIEECKNKSRKNQILIPSVEFYYLKKHIIYIGNKPIDINKVDYIINNKNRDYIIILAHAYKNNLIFKSLKKFPVLDKLDCIEIWNVHHNSKRLLPYRALSLINFIKKQKKDIKFLGGLDLHRVIIKKIIDIYVNCNNLDNQSIINSIKKGRFYLKNDNIIIKSDGDVFYKNIRLNDNILFKSIALILDISSIIKFVLVYNIGSKLLNIFGVGKEHRVGIRDKIDSFFEKL